MVQIILTVGIVIMVGAYLLINWIKKRSGSGVDVANLPTVSEDINLPKVLNGSKPDAPQDLPPVQN